MNIAVRPRIPVRHLIALATAAIACLVALPAAAQAYEVHVSITGAGQVTESTAANLVGTGCVTAATNPTGAVGVNCYPGDPSGDYGWGWVVRYVATAKPGYRFVRWQSDGGPKPVICDGANGSDVYAGSACQFATYDDLQTRAVFVDDTKPSLSSLSGPKSVVNGPAAFTFAANSEPTLRHLECRVANVHEWEVCTSGRQENPPTGNYTFQVRAVDWSGNASDELTTNWSVDKVAPETTLGPGGPSGTVSSTSAQFDFNANEQGSFICTLDGAAAPCGSPKSYAGLGNGPHTFSVQARDLAGNLDPTPATRTWTVDTTPPPPPPPPPPPVVVVVTPFDPFIASNAIWDGPKTTFTVLAIRHMPAGTKLELSCKGTRCPFKSRSLKAPEGSLNVLKKLKKLVLRAGSTFEVRLTSAKGEKKIGRWQIRKGKAPKFSTRCADPGGKLGACG